MSSRQNVNVFNVTLKAFYSIEMSSYQPRDLLICLGLLLVTCSFPSIAASKTTKSMSNRINVTGNRQTLLANLTTRMVDEKVDSKDEAVRKNKKRRYTYEDTHQWPPDDSMDYDFNDGETKEAPMWDRIGQNWQVVGLRLVFIFAALCVATMVCCCCCQIAIKACCFNLREGCRPCGPLFDIISTFYEDPMYKKAKRTAELFGLKLDYKTFMKIKETHSTGQTSVYNPLGLPWMET